MDFEIVETLSAFISSGDYEGLSLEADNILSDKSIDYESRQYVYMMKIIALQSSEKYSETCEHAAEFMEMFPGSQHFGTVKTIRDSSASIMATDHLIELRSMLRDESYEDALSKATSLVNDTSLPENAAEEAMYIRVAALLKLKRHEEAVAASDEYIKAYPAGAEYSEKVGDIRDAAAKALKKERQVLLASDFTVPYSEVLGFRLHRPLAVLDALVAPLVGHLIDYYRVPETWSSDHLSSVELTIELDAASGVLPTHLVLLIKEDLS